MNARVSRVCKLGFHFDVERLKADLERAEACSNWTAHYRQLHYSGTTWNGIALRSIGGLAEKLHASAHDEYRPTEILSVCPYFQRVLSTFKCPQRAARLLRLSSGSAVRTHVDAGTGYCYGLLRIHVPIETNDKVWLRVASKSVLMAEGETWYMDTSYPHAVVNNGDSDRTHLVVDCEINKWLLEQLSQEIPRRVRQRDMLAYRFRKYTWRAVDYARSVNGAISGLVQRLDVIASGHKSDRF